MRGQFLASTSSTIVLGFAVALATATLAAAAPPSNFNVTAMLGNEAENAIAVNPTNPSNVVAMSTLPDVVAGLAVGVSFNGGHAWTRRVIGAAGDPLGEICCDQQLAWDRFGNLWMTYLVNTSGDVLVALSTDGGSTFTKVGDIVTNGDQPSIAVGSNNVWVSYTRTPGNQIQAFGADRKSTRLNSSHSQISYAVFSLKTKNIEVVSCSGSGRPVGRTRMSIPEGYRRCSTKTAELDRGRVSATLCVRPCTHHSLCQAGL